MTRSIRNIARSVCDSWVCRVNGGHGTDRWTDERRVLVQTPTVSYWLRCIWHQTRRCSSTTLCSHCSRWTWVQTVRAMT